MQKMIYLCLGEKYFLPNQTYQRKSLFQITSYFIYRTFSLKTSFSFLQGLLERRLEMEAWLDVAKIYSNLESWPDAEICVDKSKSIEFHSPRGWHAKGLNIVSSQQRNIHFFF